MRSGGGGREAQGFVTGGLIIDRRDRYHPPRNGSMRCPSPASPLSPGGKLRRGIGILTD